MTTQKNKNDVLYFTIFFSVILSNHSTQFILVSYYVIIQIIYNPWIFSLISKWGMIPVVDFGFWKSCICTYQRKKSIFLMAKESDPSCCLESVDHQMQVNYTNGTLEVSHIPTDLAQISMCITCFCRLEMYFYLCGITTQTWIGTSAILGFFGFFL